MTIEVSEYTSNAFNSYCIEHGIHKEFTIPYTPQQNGRAERLNLSIVEGILALLKQSGLPEILWAEAAHYYLDSKNLSPHVAINGQVPNAVFYNSKPNIFNLRVFGCLPWLALPQHERTKLEQKGVPLIFFGYDHHAKAYRLYNPDTNLIRIGRNITFIENEFPALNEENLNQNEQLKPNHLITISVPCLLV